MELHLPYTNKIDLTPRINEQIRKAMKELGIESHEDINVEVSMEEDLILTVRFSPVSPGFMQSTEML